MQSRYLRSGIAVGLAVLLGLSLAGCGGSSKQPPAATPTPTPQITEEPTETPTDTPAPTPTAAPSATTAPTPTAAPTDTPVPTAEPSTSPAAGGACVVNMKTASDTAAKQAWWSAAAADTKFDVYCPGTLPSTSWHYHYGTYAKKLVTAQYSKGTVIVDVKEGNFSAGMAIALPDGSLIDGSYAFGDGLTGTLAMFDFDSSGVKYHLFVNYGMTTAYQISAPQSIGLATFKSIVDGFVKVPKA